MNKKLQVSFSFYTRILLILFIIIINLCRVTDKSPYSALSPSEWDCTSPGYYWGGNNSHTPEKFLYPSRLTNYAHSSRDLAQRCTTSCLWDYFRGWIFLSCRYNGRLQKKCFKNFCTHVFENVFHEFSIIKIIDLYAVWVFSPCYNLFWYRGLATGNWESTGCQSCSQDETAIICR